MSWIGAHAAIYRTPLGIRDRTTMLKTVVERQKSKRGFKKANVKRCQVEGLNANLTYFVFASAMKSISRDWVPIMEEVMP